MICRVLSKADWKQFEAQAHSLVFDENVDPSYYNYDFALIAEVDGKPFGYVQVRELSKDTCYWHFGGVFPALRKTIYTRKALTTLASETLKRYKYCLTNIKTTNTVMIKLELDIGFLPVGLVTQGNDAYLELRLDQKSWDVAHGH